MRSCQDSYLLEQDSSDLPCYPQTFNMSADLQPKPSSLDPNAQISSLAVNLDIAEALKNPGEYFIEELLEFQRL